MLSDTFVPRPAPSLAGIINTMGVGNIVNQPPAVNPAVVQDLAEVPKTPSNPKFIPAGLRLSNEKENPLIQEKDRAYELLKSQFAEYVTKADRNLNFWEDVPPVIRGLVDPDQDVLPIVANSQLIPRTSENEKAVLNLRKSRQNESFEKFPVFEFGNKEMSFVTWIEELEELMRKFGFKADEDWRELLMEKLGKSAQTILFDLREIPAEYDSLVKICSDLFSNEIAKREDRKIFKNLLWKGNEPLYSFVMDVQKFGRRVDPRISFPKLTKRVVNGVRSRDTSLANNLMTIFEKINGNSEIPVAEKWNNFKEEIRKFAKIYAFFDPDEISATKISGKSSAGIHSIQKDVDGEIIAPIITENSPDANFSCFACGEKGHKKKFCPNPKPTTKSPTSSPTKPARLQCQICEKLGHSAKDCYSRDRPQKRKQESGSSENLAKRFKGESPKNISEKFSANKNPPNDKNGETCIYCRTPGHLIDVCTKVPCKDCGERGHRNRTNTICKNFNKKSDDYLGVVLSQKLLFLEVQIAGKPAKFLLDTGAGRNCISKGLCKILGIPISSSDASLKSASDHSLKIAGECNFDYEIVGISENKKKDADLLEEIEDFLFSLYTQSQNQTPFVVIESFGLDGVIGFPGIVSRKMVLDCNQGFLQVYGKQFELPRKMETPFYLSKNILLKKDSAQWIQIHTDSNEKDECMIILDGSFPACSITEGILEIRNGISRVFIRNHSPYDLNLKSGTKLGDLFSVDEEINYVNSLLDIADKGEKTKLAEIDKILDFTNFKSKTKRSQMQRLLLKYFENLSGSPTGKEPNPKFKDISFPVKTRENAVPHTERDRQTSAEATKVKIEHVEDLKRRKLIEKCFGPWRAAIHLVKRKMENGDSRSIIGN